MVTKLGKLLEMAMEMVLEEVEKQYKRRAAQKMGKMSDSLPSVIIDEPKAPSAPRHGSDSSGFGSGKGEPSKGDYMTLAQKSPVKQQGQSPNGKALSSPNNAVLKESYIPKRLLMGDMDMVDHGGGMLGCGSTTSDTSESTSLSADSDCNFSVVTFESGQTEV